MERISRFIKLWVIIALAANIIFGGLYINDQAQDDTSPEDSEAALLSNERIWMEIASGNDGRPDRRVYNVGETVALDTYFSLSADAFGIENDEFTDLPQSPSYIVDSDDRSYATTTIVNSPNGIQGDTAVQLSIENNSTEARSTAVRYVEQTLPDDFEAKISIEDLPKAQGETVTAELIVVYPDENREDPYTNLALVKREDDSYYLRATHTFNEEVVSEVFTFEQDSQFGLTTTDGSLRTGRVIGMRKFQDKFRFFTYIEDENGNILSGSWTSLAEVTENVPENTSGANALFYSWTSGNTNQTVSAIYDSFKIFEINFPDVGSGRNAMNLRYQYNSNLLEFVSLDFDPQQFTVIPTDTNSEDLSCRDLKELFTERSSVHDCVELAVASPQLSFEELIFNGNQTNAFRGTLKVGTANFRVIGDSFISLDGDPNNSLEYPDPHEPSVYVIYPFGREEAIQSTASYIASDFFTVDSYLDARGNRADDSIDFFPGLDRSPGQRPGVLLSTRDVCLGDFNLRLEPTSNIIVDLDDFGTLARNYTFDIANPRILDETNRILDLDRVAVNGNYIIDISDLGLFARNYDKTTCDVKRSQYIEFN